MLKPRFRPLLAVFLAFLCMAPAAAAESAAAAPAWTQRTLANGLRVFAVRDTSSPDVSVQVWYAVGGKDDPKGRQGFAHLFEHLMFKQTRNLPAGAFVGLAEDVGGTNDASTEDDYTRYYTTVPASYLERILFAEADRMADLVIDPAEFKAERETVENEIRQRLGQPYGKVVQRYIPAASYARLPYARSTLGSIEDLDVATVEEARAFHALYYRPDNAVLVVAGNFDIEALDRWVDRYFAPIAKPAAPLPRVDATEPLREAPSQYVVHDADAPSPAVVLSYPVPRLADADTPVLAVIHALLSEGGSSRLQQGLVESGIAQASSSLLEQRQLGGSFALYAILGGDAKLADGEAALRAAVARLRDETVPADELARVKNRLFVDAVRERGTPDGKAAQLARAVLLEGDARAAERRLARVDTVSAADVQRVARAWLDDRRVAVIRYLPAEGAAKAESIAVPVTVVEQPLPALREVAVVTPANERERVPLPGPGPGKPAEVALKPVEFTLRNGLRVVVAERRGTPLVTFKMVAPAGSTNEPAGRAGLAMLAAALMTKGAAGASAIRQVEALGGSIGSGAGRDGASVGMTVRADAVAPALKVFADVVRHPRVDAAALDNARGLAADGVDDARQDAMKLARMVADRLAFGDAPYGNPRGGTKQSLAAITLDEVAAMQARAWRPDAATLIVTGDIAPAAARTLAEHAFGDWRATPAPAPVARPAAKPVAPRVVAIDLPDAAEAAVVVARAVPARADRRYAALRVANATLGGGGSSRLNSEIRYKRALSYDAGSALIDGRDAGMLVAATLTKHEAAAQVVGIINAELRRLATEAVPAQELAARRQLLVGGDGRAIETTEGLADALGNLALQSLPARTLVRSAGIVGQVDAASVLAAAKQWLDPAGASIVVVGDTKQFAEALRATWPGLEVIPATAVSLDDPSLRQP